MLGVRLIRKKKCLRNRFKFTKIFRQFNNLFFEVISAVMKMNIYFLVKIEAKFMNFSKN